MVEFSMREKSMLLVMVTQWMSRLHKGQFSPKEILNIAEYFLWRIDNKRKSYNDVGDEYRFEGYLLRGLISLDDYVMKMVHIRTAKQLRKDADDWYGSGDYGKYFGDFA